jgi:hypothetical protein
MTGTNQTARSWSRCCANRRAPMSSETIATELGLPIERVDAVLNGLEAASQVRRVGLGMWARTLKGHNTACALPWWASRYRMPGKGTS